MDQRRPPDHSCRTSDREMGQASMNGTTAASVQPDAVRVLEADPDLADVLEENELEEATCALVAPAMTLTKGAWSPRQTVPDVNGHLGVLVTEGILCREVAIGNSVCAELVGPGDLLRPWDGAGASALVPYEVRWQVLEQTRLALLGRRFTVTAARWPTLTSAFVSRAINRSQGLALAAAITCTTGLETRLLMLFRHLADRWGKVGQAGIMVPVPMTHELVGRLIGACRPSVSTALKQLERKELIARVHAGGWLLSHAAAEEALQLHARQRTAQNGDPHAHSEAVRAARRCSHAG